MPKRWIRVQPLSPGMPLPGPLLPARFLLQRVARRQLPHRCPVAQCPVRTSFSPSYRSGTETTGNTRHRIRQHPPGSEPCASDSFRAAPPGCSACRPGTSFAMAPAPSSKPGSRGCHRNRISVRLGQRQFAPYSGGWHPDWTRHERRCRTGRPARPRIQPSWQSRSSAPAAPRPAFPRCLPTAGGRFALLPLAVVVPWPPPW